MVKILLLTISYFLLSSNAHASSEANVKINNNVSSNSDSEVNSYTNITVETDGNVTRYESDEPGRIEVKSVNGESEIKVNGKVVTGSPTGTPKPEDAQSETDENSNDRKSSEDNKEKTQTFLEELLEVIKKPIEIAFNFIFWWK